MTATPTTGTPAGGRRPAPAAGRLTLRGLRKTYRARRREPFEAVRGVDLDIAPGELVALLGPSGCGKTTTLRMIAGLESVTSGDVLIGDRAVTHLPPARRDVGVGFESYALYPPLTVRENLAYGLRARRAADTERRVDAIAERLELTGVLGLRPAALSSGQKQRVALARALVRNPPVLLLDEPLSHLDTAQRGRVRRELKVLQREFGYTTIVVTHDQLEALSLADRMAVMDGGRVQQFGTPDEVFDAPANRFVADFVGEPAINLLPGEVQPGPAGGSEAVVRFGAAGALPVSLAAVPDSPHVDAGIRPQDCALVDADATAPALHATVEVFEDLMEYGLATVRMPGVADRFVVHTAGGAGLRPGQHVRVAARPDRVHLFRPETGERL